MKTSSNSNSEKKFDIYEAVTRQILRNMSGGVLPWRQTWVARKGQKPPYTNHFTGKPYSFLNTLLLGEPGEYATWNQIEDAGGHVVKGAKGKMITKWVEYVPKRYKEEKERLEKEGKDWSHLKAWVLKKYTVFNVRDTEGLKARPDKDEEKHQMVAAQDPTDVAELVIDDYTVNESVKVDASDAFSPAYIPDSDTVTVPSKGAFTYEEDYYASLFDGLVHSTAAAKRCDRKAEFKQMSGGVVSVREELIGEIGSSMILAAAGMKRRETHEQISAACQKWIREMNNDFRLIVDASRGAEKAAKLILGNYAA